MTIEEAVSQIKEANKVILASGLTRVSISDTAEVNGKTYSITSYFECYENSMLSSLGSVTPVR